MKTVYFVRHGESEANVGAEVFLGERSTLTKRGQEQARFIARRCAKLPIDLLIASTAIRARETAEAISREIEKEVEILEMFTERKLPTEILEKPRGDAESEKVYSRWLTAFYQDGLRVGDGENFADLKSRVSGALKYLAQRNESNILVVTHGFFLHMTAALVLLGDTLTSDEFTKVSRTVWMDNSGLTKLEYRTAKEKKRVDRLPYEGWILRMWNDHAHLG
ncbi:MAG: histidine phosphatase family protein [Patescibacteria group bacterium]